MNVWIQKHDFVSEEFELEKSEAVIKLLGEFDWDQELKLQKEKEDKGEDNCPPGLGIVADNGHILHLCPDKNKKYLAFFHYPEEVRFLRIFKFTPQKTLSRENLDHSTVLEIIPYMMQRQYQKIKDTLK